MLEYTKSCQCWVSEEFLEEVDTKPSALNGEQKQDYVVYKLLELNHEEPQGNKLIVEMEILTSDVDSIKQNMQRMPLAVQCEVVRHAGWSNARVSCDYTTYN